MSLQARVEGEYGRLVWRALLAEARVEELAAQLAVKGSELEQVRKELATAQKAVRPKRPRARRRA